jgi:hypothetical protein
MIFVVQMKYVKEYLIEQHIEEQEDSGRINGEQAAELRQRIEAMQNNLEC